MDVPQQLSAFAVAPGLADHLRRQAGIERIFRTISMGAAGLVLVLLGGVLISLVVGSWPALSQYSWSFLYTESWNPVTERFGALAPIYGTVITSCIAMVIAVPISFGIAVFMTEICPKRLRSPINTAIELLAAVPQHRIRDLGPASSSRRYCSIPCSLG